MITSITVRNFKCFKNEISFPISNLNLITGTNGSGKSTLLQTLILMRQSIEHNTSTNKILFNGSCLHLGSFIDLKNTGTSKSDSIDIQFSFVKGNNKGSIKYILTEEETDDMVATISRCILIGRHDDKEYQFLIKPKPGSQSLEISGTDITESKQVFLIDLVPYVIDIIDSIKKILNSVSTTLKLDKIHYVGASRIGPQDFYYKNTLSNFPNVGATGEFSANVLSRLKDELVAKSLCIGDELTLSSQIDKWFNDIFGINTVEIKLTEANILSLLINKFRPANVGFGYSYVLSIIVTCLIAKQGQIIIIENPEAHLHPQAQSRLTKFICRVAATGVQIFIESHSEHVLNGIRIATVKEKTLESNQVNVLYFDKHLEHNFEKINIDRNGKLENWPVGFFDQTETDFELLYGI